MRGVDFNLLRAADSLGAKPWQTIWHVFLPLTTRGVLAGSTLVFVLSLGFFVTPALLGGGKVTMISLIIEQQVREFLNWPLAGALSILLLAATMIIYALASLMEPKERAR
jgi:ABC-type spermidine/putrescine transport system permease subunit I